MPWIVEMRYTWLAFAFALLVSCSSTPTPTVAMISCQPFGYTPAPVSFSFTPGPVAASAAEQTAVALFRACSAPTASGEPTALTTNIKVTSNAAIGQPSGPNAGQPVWRVEIDATIFGEPAHVYSWTEVNQATGVPTIVALG